MNIQKHLDKNNLHHAYLIEGSREEVMPDVLAFLSDIGVSVVANPDFLHIAIDSFKIDEAFALREMSNQKAFALGKKIFIISANSFSPDAQGALLKMFEEPKEDTHFFIIMPEIDALVPTLLSRFYLIRTGGEDTEGLRTAEKFIAMPLRSRIDFFKEMLEDVEDEDEEEAETVSLESKRSKALKFLNSLELALHNKMSKGIFDTKTDVSFFDQIFLARKFIRQPGSSAKTLLESVALSIPEKM